MLIDNTNPKTIAGQAKPNPYLVPPVAILEIAQAFRDGAEKYGPFNWRDKPVPIVTYLAAAKRHMDAFFDGEDRSDDADVLHLAHAAACLCILIDAAACESLIDDRPKPGKSAQVIATETERNRARLAAGKVSVANHPQQKESATT